MGSKKAIPVYVQLLILQLFYFVIIAEETTVRNGYELETTNVKAAVNSADYPLTLHLAILEVTDSLGRETSQTSWQAMLRALGGHKEVLKRFSQIRQEFANLEKSVGHGKSYGIEYKLDELAKLNVSKGWSEVWPRMRTAVKRVGDLYSWFDRYQRNAAVVNDRTLKDYAEIVHSHDGLTAQNAMDTIHYYTCRETNENEPSKECENDECPYEGNALQALSEAFEKAGDAFFCTNRQSPHQMFYKLHELLALSDAKAFAMTQFSWILLRLFGKGEYLNEVEDSRKNYLRLIGEKTDAMRKTLSGASTWMWNCEDIDKVYNETKPINNETESIEITGLLQGYIINEVNLSEDSCKDSCSAYVRNEERNCAPKHACSYMRKCNGRIHDCKFIEADSHVCSSSQPNRRYDSVSYKSGRQFGSKTDCPNNNWHKVHSWWRLLYHCSYCMCLCDEPGQYSDRYVSLQSAVATTTQNRLVTGVRFVKEDRIVHIQIQQAQALPQGYVNESTIEWVPIIPIQLSPSNLHEDGPGYATLRYDERSMDLDDLKAPDNHVITGVRFRKIGGHLNLEIQTAPIDFVTGFVDADKVIWAGNDNTPLSESKPRKKHELASPDVSPSCYALSTPDSQQNEYIDFQPTSLEKDVAQTTVPFLDATDVSPNTLSWLTGVGVFHRGHADCGGYLSFRVSTYNFSSNMNTPEEYYAAIQAQDSQEESY